MNERCSNCGAELFEGQQFCRRCGAPTRRLAPDQMPTQIFPTDRPAAPSQQQQTAPQSFPRTTPLAGPDTGGIYHSTFAAQYQPPAGVPAALPTETARLQRRKSHRLRNWLIALLCVVVLFGACGFFVSQFVADRIREQRRAVAARGPGVVIPPIPAIPAIPMPPEMGDADTSGMTPLDEAGAQVSGDKTVITKTFPLKSGATFTLTQTQGEVTVEGWDQDQAQVTITKEGGDEEERASAPIMHSATDKGLTLSTPEDIKQVKYEIKLPRSLKQIEINSRESDVKLSNFAGGVAVNVLKGDLTAAQLTGRVEMHTMKGDINVDLKGATPAQAQGFNTVKGDITLAVEGANAQVQAETVAGGASADDGLGVAVEKQMVGARATGTVGRGGQEIVAKTVRGDVRIEK